VPAKIRVHALSKELGLSNKETLRLAESLGIGVSGASSSMHDAQADRVRRKAEREGLLSKKDSEADSRRAETGTAKPSAAESATKAAKKPPAAARKAAARPAPKPDPGDAAKSDQPTQQEDQPAKADSETGTQASAEAAGTGQAAGDTAQRPAAADDPHSGPDTAGKSDAPTAVGTIKGADETETVAKADDSAGTADDTAAAVGTVKEAGGPDEPPKRLISSSGNAPSPRRLAEESAAALTAKKTVKTVVKKVVKKVARPQPGDTATRGPTSGSGKPIPPPPKRPENRPTPSRKRAVTCSKSISG